MTALCRLLATLPERERDVVTCREVLDMDVPTAAADQTRARSSAKRSPAASSVSRRLQNAKRIMERPSERSL